MSENEPGDDQGQGFVREGKSGLSLPRDGAENQATETRPRSKASVYEKLRHAGSMNESVVARWFAPVAVLLVILFIVNAAMYFSQSSELAAWKSEVAALRTQLETSRSNDPGPELDRILASVEGLDARLGSVEERTAGIQALQEELAAQNDRIEALGSRIDGLEQSPDESGSTASGSGSGETSGSQPAEASGQSGDGEWVINLITVSDRASAEQVVKRLDEMGVDSRIEPTIRDGKSLHRVVVPGFQSHDQARNAVPSLKDGLELSGDPWIARQ